jgi:hypothetical protein
MLREDEEVVPLEDTESRVGARKIGTLRQRVCLREVSIDLQNVVQ